MKKIFFTHDDNFVRHFSRYLEPGISVHPIAANRLDTEMQTIEGRARIVVSAIRELQPAGPYHIAGCDANGVIAFEVATQLLGEDQQVAFLGLINTIFYPKGLAAEPDRFSLEQAIALYDPQYLPCAINIFASDVLRTEDEWLGWNSVVSKDQIRIDSIPPFPAEQGEVPSKELGISLSRAIHEAIQRPQPIPEAEYSPLVPLQVGTSPAAPLICVPGAGASVTSFAQLLMSLPQSVSVRGLEPRGIEGALIPHGTVQSAASCYTASLVKEFGISRFHLLGHSSGGWVAFDMAQRLTDSGCEVVSLTILDSDAPGDCAYREYFHADVIIKCAEAFELLFGRSLGVEREVLDRLNPTEQRISLHSCLVRQGILPSRSTAEDIRGTIRVLAMTLRSTYRPARAFIGPVNLVLADDPKQTSQANQLNHQNLVKRWEVWAPKLACFHSPGNHMTMLRAPHVETIANILQLRKVVLT